ncbi:MAG: DEAD/DEAH box helicase, partial [archaeon]
MVIIQMGNVVTRFDGINSKSKLSYIIANKLSYKIGGFGAPKEKKVLYNVKTNTTYTGLVPHVLTILKKCGIKYKLNDRRNKPEKNANFNIVAPFQPRIHQKPIIDRTSSRETIQAATGAGKTYIMAELITKFNTKPVLVVAPKVSLALQIKDEFKKFLQEDIGIVGGGFNDIQDITICTPQSISDKMIRKTKVLMFDEAHNIPSQTIFSVACKAINAYYRIGVSATPWRDGGDDLLIEAALNIRK